jgi:myo-inositol 2-dehydrogenase/D-chiro-inositol 1-dehydrogenase
VQYQVPVVTDDYRQLLADPTIAAEMNAFVSAIQQDKASPVSGQDGRVPIVIGLAAQKSLREKRVVSLGEMA